MSDTALVPGPLYGLRTWIVVGEDGRERLGAPQRKGEWPAGGEWMQAECPTGEHAPPGAGCSCGIHAWHPTRRSARRVLAGRFELPGVVEASGAVEVHVDGFRAERARPYALVVAPGRNRPRAARLAEAYGARVVDVSGPDALVAWCREHGLGLDGAVVAELLGPAVTDAGRQARRRKRRNDALRILAAAALSAAVVVLGLHFVTDPPGPRVLHGRAGAVHVGGNGR